MNYNSNTNTYGKGKPSYQEIKEQVKLLINNFKNHYSSLGYIEEPSVKITSGIDPTVRFIGSPISVFKSYLKNNIPYPGLFMYQDCLRTQNVNKMLDDEYLPNWGSFFPNTGAITKPARLIYGCNETFDYIERKLGIDIDDKVIVRISSSDKDLLNICQSLLNENNIDIDSREINYYRHKIGIDGVWGRNCNIALKKSNGEGYSDIGNLVIIENSESIICLEMSIGVSTILKEIYGLDHVLDITPVPGLELVENKYRRKFEDALITCTVLFRENLNPFGQKNANRIFKKYIQSISYFRAKCKININKFERIISEFEEREFPESIKYITNSMIEAIEVMKL
ncbi:alanine--tRNA ligase [Candidatus Magnetomorum sp. HK-1]|nr:alanine--tRNA ligase [Candidatus Magnetomorum sp. HK-1]